eukprot:TRINITY_DN23210_c0_g1_i2.p1 TRINITY_DN23210_c0_g1~~TRINITY_DN23210_c0_g1_i2.p1  ORF type:complete len:373 (-),score=94.79 TRINITY_DN23210_c0_g1_i2:2-1120(-)
MAAARGDSLVCLGFASVAATPLCRRVAWSASRAAGAHSASAGASFHHQHVRLTSSSSSGGVAPPTRAAPATTTPLVRVRRRGAPKVELSLRRSATVLGERAAAALRTLQGNWIDDRGVCVQISGALASFGDEPGQAEAIREVDGALLLRGARLDDLSIPASEDEAAAPVWEAPNGAERRWARPEPVGGGDEEWRKLFQRYKFERLQLRRQLGAAIQAQALSKIGMLQAAWRGGFGFPLPVPSEQRERLLLGQNLVPGAVIVHRKFGYRGIILACEPWCVAAAAWRAQMGVPRLARGEAQPFYHCLVDERDRPGGQVTFIAEENAEANDFAYPVEGKMHAQLFVPSAGIGGYLPSPQLQLALRRQREGKSFAI